MDKIPRIDDISLDSSFDTSGSKISFSDIKGMLIREYGNFTFTELIEEIKLSVIRRDLPTIIALSAVTIVVSSLFIYIFSASDSKVEGNKIEEEEKEPIVLRDFTLEQLREFDGLNNKPIYIALKGEVYDVSTARNFYGEGSGYFSILLKL